MGDRSYGRGVDIWAIGCMMAEMLTGIPLFAGNSDVDQLFHIMKCLGPLPPRFKDIAESNPLFVGVKVPWLLLCSFLPPLPSSHCPAP